MIKSDLKIGCLLLMVNFIVSNEYNLLQQISVKEIKKSALFFHFGIIEDLRERIYMYFFLK